ncbi:DUF4232 domain-containing protein [Streptomyces sp. NRRL B-3648]|uniref:DUF4232 domain-containing protein n=1 Tax=Streptomyces sp. NRRL B-3648 TaxID=1519493 RepID=UPI0006AEA8D7|nr:DUF4232 domain-containing protein [Streptomyces sp. NRRL B-3648]KOX11179.1 Tat pathway signal sequence domain protein [Streptomyces sp. NRRL B-3648]
MHHRHTSRVTAAALAAVAATLSLTVCQTASATAARTAPTPKAPAATVAAAATPRAAHATGSTEAARSALAHATSRSTPACTAKALEASAYQAAVRPRGTGTGAAVVQFTNVSSAACVLRGHPTVAGAGNGSPQRSVPLKVTPKGTAATVRLAPHGKAWLKLTFVQVQGEADGYCVSGATPSVFPTLVVGLPGAGKHQVALDDGLFAECDNKVTATAVSAVKPA